MKFIVATPLKNHLFDYRKDGFLMVETGDTFSPPLL